MTPQTGRKLDFFIIGVLVIALGYFIYDEFQDREETEAAVAQAVAEAETAAFAAAESAEPAAMEPSIAVLPFADMSPESDQAYFSDGISEELLNLLVRVDGLKVASRTSSFAYKGSTQSIADIAGELNVNHVLEGSVRKAQNRVRITAQLIDAQTDRHLWSDTYDRELNDIFAIQDEIANAIVDALQAELGVLAETEIEVSADTENLDAYELYLQARALFNARSNLELSITLFEQAVEVDPEFARAWEGLAAVYAVAESWRILDRDYPTLSIDAAETALALDADLSLPWAVIANQKFEQNGDYLTAEEHYDTALENDPKNTTAWLWRSIMWANLAYFDRAIADATTCLDIDPNYLNCRRHLSIHYLNNGQPDIGFPLFQSGVEIGFTGSNDVYTHYLVQNGQRMAAALFYWMTADEDDYDFPVPAILDALEFPDRDHSAGIAKLLKWAEGKDNPNATRDIQYILLAMGAYQYAEVAPFAMSWMWGEQYAGFRQSSHFKRLVKEMGLDLYWLERGFPPKCRPVGDDDFECD